MDLLVNNSFKCHYGRWIKIAPSTDIGEIAKQLIEQWGEVVVHRQPLFDQLLASPLKMFESLRYAMYVDTDRSKSNRDQEASQQLGYLQPIPRTKLHTTPFCC